MAFSGLRPKMLLNFLQCVGQFPTTKNYVAQNANSRSGFMGKQPVQSTGLRAPKGPLLGLMLCCCHVEILSNFLNKGTLNFHFALGHENYATYRGQLYGC